MKIKKISSSLKISGITVEHKNKSYELFWKSNGELAHSPSVITIPEKVLAEVEELRESLEYNLDFDEEVKSEAEELWHYDIEWEED